MKEHSKILTFLGEGTTFKGTLGFQGTIRIDGRFEGEIDAPNGTLVIGDKANVDSNVRVAGIVISGKINGNITAADRIEAHVPARITGNITAPTIVVNKGVLFTGRCLTSQDASAKKSK